MTEETGSSSTLQIKNENFIVTKWEIKPKGFIPMHKHTHAYVVVPLCNASMHVVNADGSTTIADLKEGQPYARDAGAEHRIENHNEDTEIIFIEIEKL